MWLLILLLCSSQSMVSSNRAQPILLGGPPPNGWTIKYADDDILNDIFLSMDVGSLGELKSIPLQRSVFESGLKRNNTKMSLKDLGTGAVSFSSKNPLYHYYVDAFEDIGTNYEKQQEGLFDNRPVGEYLSTIMDDLLSLNMPPDVIKESSLVMQIFMRAQTYLWKVLGICSSSISLSSPLDALDALINLDYLAAVWIGFGQTYGDNENGAMLYSLAEKAGTNFAQDQGEVFVNTQIMNLMTELQTTLEALLISTSSISSSTCTAIRRKASRIQALFYVPLVQNLIHHMYVSEGNSVELYTLSILPLLRTCDPNSFDSLMNDLVLKPYQTSRLNSTLMQVQRLYSCMGFVCDDVGEYLNGIIPRCSDAEAPSTFLQNYNINSYTAQKFGNVDRDIRQFDILLQRNQYDLAMDLYSNGRNMQVTTGSDGDSPIALQYMAKQQWNNESSFLVFFQNLFGLNYSDVLMTTTLKDYKNTANKELALRLLQLMITPHFSFNKLLEALNSCNFGAFDSSRLSWDVGASILLGSIPKGSDTVAAVRFRTTWYSVAQEMCQYFGCNSVLVNMFSSHLELGKSAIDSNNCSELRQHVDILKSTLFVPIIQGALHFSIELENNFSDPFVLGSAHAFALAIEPLVEKVNKRASKKIRDRLINYNSSDTNGTKDDVFKAFARSWYGLGVDCSLIGSYFSSPTTFCAFIDTVEPEETFTPTSSPVTVAKAPTLSPSLSPRTKIDVLDPSFRQQYNFTFNVTTEALLALDIREISKSNSSTASNIYSKSLSSINNNASSFQQTNPYYSFYRFAFRNDPNFPNHSFETYSAVIVNEALSKLTGSLASETILVMVIWMHVTNLLYSAVAACKQHDSPVLNFDKALALYIGASQSKGKENGFMLYALGQKFGKIYNTLDNDGEADANRRILDSFAKARNVSRQCTDRDGSPWVELRMIVQEIVYQMNIPLLQALDYYLSSFPQLWDQVDGNHLEIFALAVSPQLAVCYPLMYERFFQTALLDAPFTVTDDSEQRSTLSQTLYTARDKLKATLTCFGTNAAEVLGMRGDVSNPWSNNLSVAALEFSYIDRDIAKIEALLHFDATALAQDIYQHGFSSPGLSLKALATDNDRASIFLGKDQNLYYQSYVNFFSDEFYADSIIISSFHLETHPSSIHTTTMQPNTTIYKAAQTMVLFMGTLQRLHTAINMCRNGTVENSKLELDRALGLFLGSAVKPQQEITYPFDNGHSLYALANEFCEPFNTCFDIEKIIDSFAAGTTLLDQGLCDDVLELVETSIKPLVLTSIIQATIKSSVQIENSTDANNNMFAYASGNVYALSLIPLVNAIDPDAAKIISLNMGVNTNALFSVLKSVLPKFHIICTNIHVEKVISDGCDSFDSSDGNSSVVYKTFSNVTDLARIDLDVKLMVDALSKNEMNLAEIIYSDGFHSSMSTGKWNLANFSRQASKVMTNESTFNFFMFALADQSGKYLGADAGSFGDSIVRSFFNETLFGLRENYRSLSVEAAIALNLWLYVTHQLYSAVAQCKNGSADVALIDAAAAYWIGSLPLEGNSSQGYLLYSLSENVATLFNQKSSGGPSSTNKKLLQLFKQASILLRSPRACQGGTSTVSHLRSVIIQSISQMTIPLIQHLVASLREKDRPRVKIYAHAVVPLLVGCRSSTFNFLKSTLLQDSYSDVDVEEIIIKIEGVYNCLDLSCDSIGSYKGYNKTCVDTTVDTPLAGFVPTTDIRAISKLDLDVKEIEIMLMMGARSSARDVYMMGKHCPSIISTQGNDFISLYSLATDTGRDIVPDYQWFVMYYGDVNYAHTLVSNITQSIYSKQQEALLVSNTLSYLVLPMASMQRLFGAISLCNSGALTSARTLWNEAAAMLIGSLDGNNEEGVAGNDGYLAHFWANYLCEPFGVCEMGYSHVNHVIMILLNSGRAALDAKQCSILEEHATQISQKMLIPFIQGSLLYSSAKSLVHSSYSTSFDFLYTSGYISSRVILPYVYSVDRRAVSLLDRNLNFDMKMTYDRNSNLKVFQIVEEVISKLSGVDCSDVGYLKNVKLGVCPGKIGDPKSQKGGSLGKVWVWSLIFLILLSLFVWFTLKRGRKPSNSEVDDNRPKDEEEISFPKQDRTTEHQLD